MGKYINAKQYKIYLMNMEGVFHSFGHYLLHSNGNDNLILPENICKNVLQFLLKFAHNQIKSNCASTVKASESYLVESRSSVCVTDAVR